MTQSSVKISHFIGVWVCNMLSFFPKDLCYSSTCCIYSMCLVNIHAQKWWRTVNIEHWAENKEQSDTVHILAGSNDVLEPLLAAWKSHCGDKHSRVVSVFLSNCQWERRETLLHTTQITAAEIIHKDTNADIPPKASILKLMFVKSAWPLK